MKWKILGNSVVILRSPCEVELRFYSRHHLYKWVPDERSISIVRLWMAIIWTIFLASKTIKSFLFPVPNNRWKLAQKNYPIKRQFSKKKSLKSLPEFGGNGGGIRRDLCPSIFRRVMSTFIYKMAAHCCSCLAHRALYSCDLHACQLRFSCGKQRAYKLQVPWNLFPFLYNFPWFMVWFLSLFLSDLYLQGSILELSESFLQILWRFSNFWCLRVHFGPFWHYLVLFFNILFL